MRSPAASSAGAAAPARCTNTTPTTCRPSSTSAPAAPPASPSATAPSSPPKYQDALFLCDWSFGKLYACHLKPKGATYTGELEEFLNGSPLPLTDIVINPKDGAMYFTIGGRSTMSGLYRVTYIGKESTGSRKSSLTRPGSAMPRSGAARFRKKLESYYGKTDPKAVETSPGRT